MGWLAALFAIFAWWFSTGVILVAVRHADRAGRHLALCLAALPLAGAGLAALVWSLGRTDVAGAYAGFLAALAIWGWIELAFLTGVIVGPNRAPPPPGLTGLTRLSNAWTAVSHHEILLAFGLLLVVVASTHAPNQVALWTYLILFGARISAKLNLFLGAPRINVEFVPAPLEHLKGHFRRGPVTFAFPAAITLLSFTAACLMIQLARAEGPAEASAFALVATLSVLALVEHWLMVVPLPDAKLWRWMLPTPSEILPAAPRHEPKREMT